MSRVYFSVYTNFDHLPPSRPSSRSVYVLLFERDSRRVIHSSSVIYRKQILDREG